jgi:hypothetical protein
VLLLAAASSPTLVARCLPVSTLSLLHFSLLQKDDPPAAPGKKGRRTAKRCRALLLPARPSHPNTTNTTTTTTTLFFSPPHFP